MRHFTICLFAAVAWAQAASAQDRPPVQLTDVRSILRLSETATVRVVPSLLTAEMSASADARTAVAAQRQVNDVMRDAAALAGKVDGVKPVFRNYATNFTEGSAHVAAHWTASQTLELGGQNGDAILALVGQLQEHGLTLTDLSWSVPREELAAARAKAQLEAIADLRKQAAAAAHALDLVIARYQMVDLDGGHVPVGLREDNLPMARAAAVASMAAPIATRDTQDVTATVSATVVLRAPDAAGSKTP